MPRAEQEYVVDEHHIEQWWPRVEIRAKEWLREHPQASDLPDHVRAGIAAAGGPAREPLLSDSDWSFIWTQSEFVD